MLVIRFNRTGKKNHGSFRIALQEHTRAPGKRHVELLGSYDPHQKKTILKKERILHWLSLGAQPSAVVSNLLIREKVIEGKKIAKKMPRPVKKEENAGEDVAPVTTEKESAAAVPGVAPASEVEPTPVVSAAASVAPEAPAAEEMNSASS